MECIQMKWMVYKQNGEYLNEMDCRIIINEMEGI